MNFHIVTPDGMTHTIEFPDDQPVGLMLRELVVDESLKLRPPKPESWHLLRENSEHKLDLNKNLEENGVHRGERLRLLSRGTDTVPPQKPTSGNGMTRCDNGHYYDKKKHTAGCPHCGANIGPNPNSSRSIKIDSSVTDSQTRPYSSMKIPPVGGADEDAITKIYSPGGTTAIDPVVGWLVDIHGPKKGADYRIRSENNTIGRSKDMYICISGDESISRERHAVITFDPINNAFFLGPGDGRGLVYVNGEALLAPRKLQPYDRIQLGKTKLLFVPFCGEKYSWGKDDE